jgi:hypothetical protein
MCSLTTGTGEETSPSKHYLSKKVNYFTCKFFYNFIGKKLVKRKISLNHAKSAEALIKSHRKRDYVFFGSFCDKRL